MAEMERDKMNKLEDYKKEIQRKQEQIDKNEEFNQNKNIKIIR